MTGNRVTQVPESIHPIDGVQSLPPPQARNNVERVTAKGAILQRSRMFPVKQTHRVLKKAFGAVAANAIWIIVIGIVNQGPLVVIKAALEQWKFSQCMSTASTRYAVESPWTNPIDSVP